MRLPSILRALLQHPTPKASPQEPTMAAREAESMLAKVALECGGDISASQEEILATSSFLGGDNALLASASDEEEEEEVFATPPDATQQQDHDDPVVTMCTLPFTPTPSKSSRSPKPPSHLPQSKSPAAPSPDADDEDVPLANPRRKPRVCTRKIRGARISTPTPSPEEQQQPKQHPQAEQQQQPEQRPQAEPQQQPAPQPVHVDPLIRAVLMIPTKTTAAATASSNQNPVEDFLALCRQKGLI